MPSYCPRLNRSDLMVLLLKEEREERQPKGKIILFQVEACLKTTLRDVVQLYIQPCFKSNGIISILQMRKLRAKNEEGLIQY